MFDNGLDKQKKKKKKKLVKPTCSSDIRKYLFTSRVIDVLNCLNDIVKSPSISVFKKRLSGVKFDRFLTVTN